MNWRDKSNGITLFFCTTAECNVITFRNPFHGTCPKCHEPGALVRPPIEERVGIRDTRIGQ